MGKVLAWLGGKLLDKAFDWMVGGLAGFLAWLVYSPFWGGWRAVCIGLTVGGIVLGIIAIRRRENSITTPAYQRQAEMKRAIALLDSEERMIVSAFGQSQLNTRKLDFDDPIVAGLLAKGVLILASRHGQLEDGRDGELHKMVPMMLSPVATKCLWG